MEPEKKYHTVKEITQSEVDELLKERQRLTNRIEEINNLLVANQAKGDWTYTLMWQDMKMTPGFKVLGMKKEFLTKSFRFVDMMGKENISYFKVKGKKMQQHVWVFDVILLDNWPHLNLWKGKKVKFHLPYDSFYDQLRDYLKNNMKKNMQWIQDTKPILDIKIRRHIQKPVIEDIKIVNIDTPIYSN